MNLIKTINTIIEEKTIPKWAIKMINSRGYEEISDYIKLFSDLHTLYLELEKLGLGVQFLDNIYRNWTYPSNRYHIINALGSKNIVNKSIDKTILYKYVLNDMIGEVDNLKITKEGRIYLTLTNEDKVELFDEKKYYMGENCKKIAEMVFNDGIANNWDNDMWVPDLEYLVDSLSEKNYEKLVKTVLEKFETLTCFREEFENWVEEDNIGEDEFYVDINRFNYFLDTNTDRYNFTVLLGCADELKQLTKFLEKSYLKAYKTALNKEYIREYNNEIEEAFGKPIDNITVSRTSVEKVDSFYKNLKKTVDAEIYDVTNLVYNLFIDMALYNTDIYSGNFINIYRREVGVDCPYVDAPDDDVLDYYNEYFDEHIYD